jgi:hypothetical protein
MEHQSTFIQFPPGFPSALASEVHVHGGETSWRLQSAIAAINWFGAHQYAVLGTEVFLLQSEGLQSLPYFQSIDCKKNEDWNSFVIRAASETIRYLTAFQQQLGR